MSGLGKGFTAAAFLVMVFLAGIVVGRQTAPTRPASPDPEGNARAFDDRTAPGDTHTGSGRDDAPHVSGNKAFAPPHSADVHELFAAYRTTKTYARRRILRSAILDRLRRDPDRLARVLDDFAQSGDEAALAAWTEILGQFDDPRVRSAVERMAADGTRSESARTAALGILERQNHPDSVPGLLPLLEGATGPAILRAAIAALPSPRGLAAADVHVVVRSLVSHVGSSADETVRRNAAIALGEWGGDDLSRTALTTALDGDPSPNVRAAAAFSLIYVRPKDHALLARLAGKVGDRGEAWPVRLNAWRALNSERSLPDDISRVFREFRKEKEHSASD